MKTTTLKELERTYTGTYSVKADTVKGRKEVSFYDLQVGDEVLIDNYFTLIIEEEEQEGEDMNNEALLLTQYEKYGTVGEDEIKEMYIDEELEITVNMIGDYNEYLIEQGYEPYYDDLDQMLEGFSPLEVAQKTFYGKFNYAYEFHQFNGYENIDSFEDFDIIREMKNDTGFLLWYIDENKLIDWDEAQEIIKEANKLISKGY